MRARRRKYEGKSGNWASYTFYIGEEIGHSAPGHEWPLSASADRSDQLRHNQKSFLFRILINWG